MNCTKQTKHDGRNPRGDQRAKATSLRNKVLLKDLLEWYVPEGAMFTKDQFHGNIKWSPEQLVAQAIAWSWQETKNVTDAFDHALEVCEELKMKQVANSYTSMMNALNRYGDVFTTRLRERYQELAEEVGDRHFRTGDWVLMGFDGSRATAPRSVSNERALCAPNYGHGKRAKYGKKKSKGMRRKRNVANPAHPQAPQAWITMMWQMSLRLPWTWRLGPSNSSERGHVIEMLEQEHFPKKTLFCGDAGFIGYPLWSTIMSRGHDFLIRVGANVSLLSEQADVKKCGGGIVLCWPKGKMESGSPPLRLRLIRVAIGKTKMWILTSVVDRKQLSCKQIIRYYKMRWGIEIEFRGLKQTIDKHKLRCRNSEHLLVELDWAIRAMAFAELAALREQISVKSQAEPESYNPCDRSLANVMRALRKCMRNLNKSMPVGDRLLDQLSKAFVERYDNRTDKRARYRPKNPDKKPLGVPKVRKMNATERNKMCQTIERIAA